MIAVLLFVIAIASFLFYGVVGQDKTWLLAPTFLLTYTLIAMSLVSRALGTRHLALGGARGAESRSESATSNQQPVTALLWILFLIYGVAMIPYAAVPFEAKLVTLFIGGVVGAYMVWGGELTTFKDNRILLGALIFVVMLTALYGLIIHFKCPDRVLWAERYAMYEGRLKATYICPNHFAHLMQMLMPFCVALLFIPQAGLYLKMLSAYSLLAFLPPLFLTESRAGWLGSIAATGVVLCLMALRRSKKLFLFLVIFVPLCSTLLLFAGWQYSETFQRRMTPVVEFLKHQSEEGVGSEAKDFRPQTWMDTIDMIKESPLIGFGPGNYRYTFPEHRKRCRATRIVTGHPHNEYLELMADYGLVGFGLFVLAWCYGLIRILIASLKAEETRHAFLGFAFLGTAAGTMVHSFFDFQMHVYPNALVFALLAVLAWGPLAAQRAKGIRQKALGIGGEDRGQRTENSRQGMALGVRL
jgi:O-antigen ligase